jgi:phosphoribosylanthranilate isomerase
VLQLVDAVADEDLKQLRTELPDLKLVQVINVTGPASVDEALAASPRVDALLLDSGNPQLAVKQLGGTGRTHDWAYSRAIVDRSPMPVWLAGGLNAGNLGAAIEAVRPYGIDLCSSVRSDGRLNAGKLAAFMAAVRSSAQ